MMVAMLDVAVVPRATAERVGPWSEGVLKVRVTRPPSEGEANVAVVAAVAHALELAPSRLEVVAGRRSRRKRLRIDGIDRAELLARLAALAD
jgi:uncharacterized protein YggU (UPF0235/DUF167 family)